MLKLREESITWQVVDDEIVCLDLAESRYLSINAAGAALWPKLVDGAEFDDLVSTLITKFDIDKDVAVRDATAFTAMLGDRNLLQTG